MAAADQRSRFRALRDPTEVRGLDIQRKDEEHARALAEIVVRHGYPTIAMVGEAAMRALAILVLHQDEQVEVQERFLLNCDFAPRQAAYLTDRVLVNRGEHQLYGTQLRPGTDGKSRPWPIRNPTTVDSLREAVGLEPLAAYLLAVNTSAF